MATVGVFDMAIEALRLARSGVRPGGGRPGGVPIHGFARAHAGRASGVALASASSK